MRQPMRLHTTYGTSHGISHGTIHEIHLWHDPWGVPCDDPRIACPISWVVPHAVGVAQVVSWLVPSDIPGDG